MGALSGLSANTGNSAITGVISTALALPTSNMLGAWESDNVVLSGTQVNRIIDKGPNAIDLTRLSGSPQLVSGVIYFDGIDDAMQNGAVDAPITSASLILVAKFIGPGRSLVGLGKDASSPPLGLGRTTDNKLALFDVDNIVAASTANIDSVSYYCASVVASASGHDIYLNGSLAASTTVPYGVSGSNRIRISRAIKGSATFIELEFKAMAIYSGSAEHAAAVAYFMDKYGI